MHEHEQHLQILNAIPEGIMAQDPSGRLLFANDAAASVLGFTSAAELLATPVDEITRRFEVFDEHGELLPLETLPGRQALQGQTPPKKVVKFRAAGSGEEHWACVTAAPVFDDGGQVAFAVNLFQDITEQRNANAEIEKRARQQEAVVELGQRALSGAPLDELMDLVTTVVAGCLDLDQTAVLERVGDELILRAGMGWPDGVVGELRVPTGTRTLAGFTLLQDEPVVVPDLHQESRFEIHPLLREVGARSGVSVILRAKDQPFGVINGFSSTPRTFTTNDINFLQAMANVLAAASQRIWVEEVQMELLALEREARDSAEASTRELRAIQKVTDAALAHLSLDDLLNELMTRIRSELVVDTVAVLLPADDGSNDLVVTAAIGLEEEVEIQQRVPYGRGVAGRIAASGEPIVVEDISTTEIVSKTLLSGGVTSLAGVPLILGNRVGVLHVGSIERRAFTPQDVSLLRLVADRVANAIERVRLFEAEQAARRAMEVATERLRFLAGASEALARSLDHEQTLAEVARLAVPSVADWCAIHLVEDGEIRPLEVAHVDPSKAELAKEMQVDYPPDPSATTGVANVLRTGRSELYGEIPVEVLEAAARDERHLEILKSLQLRSAMVVPLKTRDRTIGAITFVAAESGRIYGEGDLSFAEELAHHAALAIDNSRLFTDIQETEHHFRTLVQSLDAIFWEVDTDTFQFTFVSQRAEEMLGYPLERWREPGFWIAILHPDDRDEAVSSSRGATARGEDHDLEYRVVTADGRTVWLKDIVSVIREKGGRKRLRGVMVDITEQKESERVLQESKDRYEYLARTLQRSLMPPSPEVLPGFRVAARYRAAGEGNQVGGDFYDVFRMAGEASAIVMGDVCGKGPTAAALTGLARHTIRAASAYEKTPSRILEFLNEAILHEQLDGQFCTVAFARLERNGGLARLILSIGGHPLPLLLRADGTVDYAGRPGTLIGVLEDPSLGDDEIDIAPGDTIVFYTDGVAEERGPDIEESWLPRLLPSLVGRDVEEIASTIETAAVDLLPGEPRDDIALLVVRYEG